MQTEQDCDQNDGDLDDDFERDWDVYFYAVHVVPNKVYNLVWDYLEKLGHNADIFEHIKITDLVVFKSEVLSYSYVAQKQDIYTSGLAEKFANQRQLKKDFTKIKESAESLLTLLECTQAGGILVSKSRARKKSRFYGGRNNLLKMVSSIVESEIEDLMPIGLGRMPSEERAFRVALVSKIMRMAKAVDAPHGTGCTGSFSELILDIYEVLEVPVTNIGRDLRDAKQLQLDTKKREIR